MRRLRLTAAARRDVADLLDWSSTRFGPLGRKRYEVCIAAALRDIAEDGVRAGSRERPELGEGLRSYHMRLSGRRARTRDGSVRSPRHILFYRIVEPDLVLVLRVLHEAMDVAQHLSPGPATSDGEQG